jgi:hypothetical protein
MKRIVAVLGDYWHDEKISKNCLKETFKNSSDFIIEFVSYKELPLAVFF